MEIPFEITQPLTRNVKNSNLLTIWSCSSHWQIVASRRIRKNIHLSFIFHNFFCPWWGLSFDPKRNDPSPAAAIHKLEKNVVRFTLLSVFFFLFTFSENHICKIVYFAKTGIRKITLHLLGETSLYQISLGTIPKK